MMSFILMIFLLDLHPNILVDHSNRFMLIHSLVENFICLVLNISVLDFHNSIFA